MSVAGRTGSHTSAFTASGEKFGIDHDGLHALGAQLGHAAARFCRLGLTEGWAPHMHHDLGLVVGVRTWNISCTALSAMDWSLPP